jgi:Fur family ferric uptake transcriptional regulator
VGHGHGWGRMLKGCGFRLTSAREAVLDILNTTEEHLSAEDIYLLLRGTYPGIGLTTVYRTLDILEQMRIVHRFEFGQDRAKYELTEEYGHKQHHHHLICKACGRIIDYYDFVDEEKSFIDKTENALEKKHAFEIKEHLIHFYGVCPECKNQEKRQHS